MNERKKNKSSKKKKEKKKSEGGDADRKTRAASPRNRPCRHGLFLRTSGTKRAAEFEWSPHRCGPIQLMERRWTRRRQLRGPEVRSEAVTLVMAVLVIYLLSIDSFLFSIPGLSEETRPRRCVRISSWFSPRHPR